MNPHFWLFCTVIDNFGDVGVAWRLAQALARKFDATVHLWLDDFSALQKIAPDAAQSVVQLHAWQEGQEIDISQFEIPQLVIETFACTLPENVVTLMAKHRILWLNWEYLSAEDWAVRTHAMPSLQRNGASKYFWQMGFLPETGGLLREEDLMTRANHYSQHHAENTDLTLFLFGYQSPVWAKWLRIWQQLQRPLTLHLADNKIINSLKAQQFLPEHALIESDVYHSGCLKLCRLPFVPQQQFDELLWQADILMIRGEDSFVRAQYAGKPFMWHIYPQQEQAHLEKLAAFWRLPFHLAQNNPVFTEIKTFQAAFLALSNELNGGQILDEKTCAQYWQTLFDGLPIWRLLAQNWRDYLWQQSDAMTRLATFLAEKTK